MSPIFSLMAKEQQEYLQRSKKFPVMVCLQLCVRALNNARGKKRHKQRQSHHDADNDGGSHFYEHEIPKCDQSHLYFCRAKSLLFGINCRLQPADVGRKESKGTKQTSFASKATSVPHMQLIKIYSAR